MSHGTKDLTHGPLAKQILFFSLPLIVSNLLQVLFNMADLVVVGRFVGPEALGSVGSTTTLITLFTGFLMGMGSGVNVMVARYFGAQSRKDVEETVHTSVILCLLTGVVILLCGLFFARGLLEMLNTKDVLIDGAALYLRIYFLGMPAMAIYNFGNAVFSAVGDTKKPLLFLTTAGVANVFLNLFFVIVCGLGVAGVAIASAASQCVCAALILVSLFKSREVIGLRFRALRVHGEKAKFVLRLGVPSGLQNAIFAVANLFIQSGVNTQRCGGELRRARVRRDERVLYGVLQFYQPEPWRAKERTRDEELFYLPRLFLRRGRGAGAFAGSVRPPVPDAVYDGRSRAAGRHGAPARDGFFLYGFRADGQHHRRLARHRQEPCADDNRHHGLVRFPRGVGVYGFRLFPYDRFAVPAVRFLLDDYRCGGDRLLCGEL